MNAFIVLLVIIAIFPALVFAGEIYGHIRSGIDDITAGARIEVEQSGNVYSTITRKYGAYRIYVPTTGKAIFKLYVGNSSFITTIYSFERPARYDFTLEDNILRMK
jgi:hypothetical protein